MKRIYRFPKVSFAKFSETVSACTITERFPSLELGVCESKISFDKTDAGMVVWRFIKIWRDWVKLTSVFLLESSPTST